MRQILMSKPGEFSYREDKNQVRSAAVKMLASVFQKEDSLTIENKENKECVIIWSSNSKDKV